MADRGAGQHPLIAGPDSRSHNPGIDFDVSDEQRIAFEEMRIETFCPRPRFGSQDQVGSDVDARYLDSIASGPKGKLT